MLRTIIFKILLGTYFVLWSPILLIGLISKKLNTFFVLKCAAGVLLLARIIAGIKYTVHYPLLEENGVPVAPNGNLRLDGKAIIAAKHMSILEIAILSNIVPNSFFIIKRELLWIPIYGWAFWRMGLQPVNRTRGATNMQKLTSAVAEKIMDGKILIIFPEGTRAKPGQKIAFVGSTGAGKTTITNLLNRFYDIEEGEITIDGVNIKDIKMEYLRSNIAMVLQDTHLFSGTVRENIRYGRLDATDEEVEQAAKTASAHSFIMRLDKGYDTVLEGDGANLSQGQRQLLNIARAALSKAPILVLDEATSSVDTRTERHLEHGMDRLMKNRTTFVIAHRLSTVRNSNAIMVLEKGEIIERGSHEDLLALHGRYYELYTGKAELD